MNNASANTHAHSFTSQITSLPQILDVSGLEQTFGIGRTTAYHLAAVGEIQSLTLGAPGKRGRRVFLTQSVIEYVTRRLAESKPLSCGSQKQSND